MQRWKASGWTREGRDLQNSDLWMLLDKVLTEYQTRGIEIEVKHVPAHVGVYGNEKANRLAAAASKRAHRNAHMSRRERDERNLESMADGIVASLLAQVK